VNVHQYHHQSLLHKLSSVVFLVYQFHHDQSSLNVFHLSHHDHVTSSSNVGSNMDPDLHDEPSFNVLLLQLHTQLHEMSSFNTNPLKFVLFVNSTVLVFNKLAQLLMFNHMVLHFLMLVHSLLKLVLLVLLKISHHLVPLDMLVMVLVPMVKNHGVVHQVS